MKFPRHKASMTIDHNPHLACYESVQEWVSDFHPDCWASDAEKKSAIANGELWTVQWYPDTPIGFMVVHASSFEAAIAAAVKIQEEGDSQ